MKKTLTAVLLAALILTACGGKPTPAPTAVPPPATATNTAAPIVTPTVPPTATVGATAVSPSTPTSAPVAVATNPPDCTNRASFVADMTAPDYTAFTAGESIHKVWRVKNTGTCAWTSKYNLVFNSGNQFGAPDSIPLAATAAGETLDIAVDMTAPGSLATYRTFFEMHTPSDAIIPIDQGSLLWVIFNVTATTANSGGSGGGGAGGSGGGSGGGIGLVNSTCGYTTAQANVDAVVAAINDYRVQNGLSPYTVNSLLNTAAQSHSADMACNQLFYHNGSNGSSPTSRVAAAGYAASSVSENVYGSWPPLRECLKSHGAASLRSISRIMAM